MFSAVSSCFSVDVWLTTNGSAAPFTVWRFHVPATLANVGADGESLPHAVAIVPRQSAAAKNVLSLRTDGMKRPRWWVGWEIIRIAAISRQEPDQTDELLRGS